MKEKRTNNEITAFCFGCKHSTIRSGREFICNRPGYGATEVTAAAIDAFFGERCKGYEATAAEPRK